jgi:TrbC/VIRB2 pilin
MQNSPNPNSADLRKPQKRFLKKGLLTFAACIALAHEVFAQSTTSPWTQAVQALQTAFTGPIDPHRISFSYFFRFEVPLIDKGQNTFNSRPTKESSR